MHRKCLPTRPNCCAKRGEYWPPAAGFWPRCPIGAGCGRGWIRRRSGKAGPIRGPRSRSCCATPGSPRPAGARRSMCRRYPAAGFCARRSRGSAPALRQAGLSRHPGAARKAKAGAVAAAGSRAFAGRRRDAVTAVDRLSTQGTVPRPAARPDAPRWHRASASHWHSLGDRCR
jgi:hypothetical protein